MLCLVQVSESSTRLISFIPLENNSSSQHVIIIIIIIIIVVAVIVVVVAFVIIVIVTNYFTLNRDPPYRKNFHRTMTPESCSNMDA